MEKKLTTKVQKLNPKLPDNTNNISNTLTIEADDELTLEKKGTIYAVFDISGKESLDYLLVTKVVHDVLHDSYFQSESVSPIQAIEKAILQLRDNVVKLASQGSEGETLMAFNIATAVLWGNTLYLVQYGSTKIYLMREGQIKPVSAASEGNFAVASGVVKDNDVVILATEDFTRKYPPEDLVSSSGMQMDTLDSLQSAMILKFNIVQTFSQSEVVDFGAKPTSNNKPSKEKTAAAAAAAAGLASEKPEKRKKKDKTNDITKGKKEKRWLIPVIALFSVLALVAIGGSVLKTNQQLDQSATEIQEVVEEQTKEEEVQEEVTETVNFNRARVVDPAVVYDLKLVEDTAEANDIAVVGNTLVATNNTTGEVFTSSASAPNFEKETYTFSGIENLQPYSGNLAFNDEVGFKSLDLSIDSVDESYAQTGLGLMTTYLDFVYGLSGDTITRYTKGTGVLEGTTWAQSDNFVGAKALGVNVSIYLVDANGEIQKYTAGAQDDFTVEGLDKNPSNAVQLVADTDLAYMYVADAGDKRVIVFDEDGNLIEQITVENPDIWNDIRGISVNSQETKLYVLDGDIIYEVDIEVTEIEPEPTPEVVPPETNTTPDPVDPVGSEGTGTSDQNVTQ